MFHFLCVIIIIAFYICVCLNGNCNNFMRKKSSVLVFSHYSLFNFVGWLVLQIIEILIEVLVKNFVRTILGEICNTLTYRRQSVCNNAFFPLKIT